MTGLPAPLAAALEGALGVRTRRALPLGGGMICQSARLQTTDGDLFVKWRPAAPPGFFAAEADGLARLADAGQLRVPRVLAYRDGEGGEDDARDAAPPFLALEYVEQCRPDDASDLHRRFGESLAAQHRLPPSEGCGYGLQRDNYLGLLPQDNTPTPSWGAFYRDRRLAPQVAAARARGLLPPPRERLVDRLLERVDALLAGAPTRPSLLHGDLWSGNLLLAADGPVVIDPAVYYGEREVEIAYMELFSGFAPDALAAYRSAYPLDAGYEARRPLHQLYPLLVHLNHFGEQYGPDVEHVCRLYLDSGTRLEGPA